jgi:ATP-dependent Clp protease ATP-binding subunit ClpA
VTRLNASSSARRSSRRRGHAELTGDHLFVALAQAEWNLFAEVVRAVDLNPQAIVIEVEQVLAARPSVEGADVRVSGDTRLLARLALHRATRGGHQAIEPADLFAALLDDAHGALASVFRAHGVDANDVAIRLSVLLRDLGVRDEKLLKRFELPPYLKQCATHLNLLARQDRVPLSEYQDGAAADKLIGMPRGIVGSQRGGTLTNQIADNPYTVVLLDEIEKANPSVLNVFLQAFDEGWLTDGRGKRVYLSDSIVIMTSNIGSEHFRKLRNPLGFLAGEVPLQQVEADVRREMERRFSPEFRNRIDDIVLFSPLTYAEAREIAEHDLSTVTAALARAEKGLDIDAESSINWFVTGTAPRTARGCSSV